MGYIAPVNHYQYAQYQNREIGLKYDPFKIIPIERMQPIEKRTEVSRKEEAASIFSSFGISALEGEKNTYKRKRIEKVYSEMTGKGKLFNESV
ncbi:hypothetical protein RCG23_06035 [Neobacillus sp. PS3-34]|uniref:hypothetical protein n=1 Tax=Neobacillus sp. PS3-34 TaxID=3070678 RepID=UPI0027E0046B|nr:hypothetical protein [Neobacillus sp. PS3-34]WML49544.1 hypothetical protein RCG23_06035 [Neobacillus sp. PS3-34]